MSDLKTRALTKVSSSDTIQHPLGILDRQITGKELQDNPEKWLKLYGSLYKNKETLEHEVNTRFKKTGKNVGSKNRLFIGKSTDSQGNNQNKFPQFAVIMPNGKKDKKKVELERFTKIVAERKAKAEIELAERKAKAEKKVTKKVTKKAPKKSE